MQIFVASLQTGDTTAAAQLLTTEARKQLAQANFQIQALGGTTEFRVLGSTYTDLAKNVALVDSTLEQAGQPQPLNTVFECRRENSGWFISGMAIQLNGQTTMALEFENPASLATLKTAIDSAFKNTNREPGAVSTGTVSDSGSKQPSAPTSQFASSSLESSKAVIEAAYAYEEALQLAVEGRLLWQKGLTNSNDYTSSKRKAAKAKAIWAAISRDLQTRTQILEEEISTKEREISELKSEAQREKLVFERTKLVSELTSLHETRAWAVDFEKQSLEPLEKDLEQSDDKNPDTKPDTKPDPEPKGQSPNE